MKRKLVVMLSLVGLAASGTAFAADDALINKLVEKGTITSEDAQAIRSGEKYAQNDTQPGAEAATPQKTEKRGLNYGGLNLQLGGFIEAATIYRSRSESTDIGSSFSGIPFSNNSKYHVSEFRGTARQSRFSVLAQGDYSKDTHLAAYYELDFLGASGTSNSNESNSFLPRTRHLYATIDWDNLGLHLLTGQTWSLATMNNKGITARNEWIPAQIDAQYVPGFTWARQWQARIVKDWDKTIWAAVSVENPQTTTGGNPSSTGDLYSFPGTGQLNTGGSFSINYFPDVIAKVAVEPGWGHYEVYDLFRSYEWTAPDGTGHKRATSNAVGAGAILPVVPGFADLSASGLYGHGIGRYGSAQLADATFASDGKLVPLMGHQALVGLILHPNKDWDVYGYAGEEKVNKAPSGGTVGYGNPAFNISACAAPATSAGACSANVNTVDQLTGGVWWKFYQGNMGKAQFGVQYSYTTVSTYSGSNGAGGQLAPSTNDQMVFTSFRYYPL